jgi:hypothetical protein
MRRHRSTQNAPQLRGLIDAGARCDGGVQLQKPRIQAGQRIRKKA